MAKAKKIGGRAKGGDTPNNAKGATKFNREVFLKTLRESSNVSFSAMRAGVSRGRAYELRNKDESLAAEWDDAVEEATDKLELIARESATTGTPEPVVYMGQIMKDPDTGQPLVIHKRSEFVLMRLLEAHRPQKFAKHQVNTLQGPGGGPIRQRVDQVTREMSDEEAAQLYQEMIQGEAE